jgi:hypothetical protein
MIGGLGTEKPPDGRCSPVRRSLLRVILKELPGHLGNRLPIPRCFSLSRSPDMLGHPDGTYRVPVFLARHGSTRGRAWRRCPHRVCQLHRTRPEPCCAPPGPHLAPFPRGERMCSRLAPRPTRSRTRGRRGHHGATDDLGLPPNAPPCPVIGRLLRRQSAHKPQRIATTRPGRHRPMSTRRPPRRNRPQWCG